MIELNDLRFFQALANAPSLAAAARHLGVTPPAVTQRLASLETRLALRLIDRGTQGISLTDDGAHLLRCARRVLKEAEELTEEMTLRRGALSGSLKVVAPLGFGRLRIAPVLAKFAQEHLDVAPELTLSDNPRQVMNQEGWDILIHVGRLPDLSVKQHLLRNNRRLLCAAPSYLEKHGAPDALQDLGRHRCGVVRENDLDVTLWNLSDQKNETQRVRITPSFVSNDGEVVRDWALRGMGIIERSEWSVAEDIATGRLVRVLSDFTLPDANIVALVRPNGMRSRKVEMSLEILKTHL
ncbi:MAG: LysR family transcriptional regulator [Sulfitobacter sp.]